MYVQDFMAVKKDNGLFYVTFLDVSKDYGDQPEVDMYQLFDVVMAAQPANGVEYSLLDILDMKGRMQVTIYLNGTCAGMDTYTDVEENVDFCKDVLAKATQIFYKDGYYYCIGSAYYDNCGWTRQYDDSMGLRLEETCVTSAPPIPNFPGYQLRLDYCFAGSDIRRAPELPDNVISMIGAFKNCKQLTDLPVFPRKCVHAPRCFEGCTSLKTIYFDQNDYPNLDPYMLFGDSCVEQLTLLNIKHEAVITVCAGANEVSRLTVSDNMTPSLQKIQGCFPRLITISLA